MSTAHKLEANASVTAASAATRGKLLRRSEAARILGISVSTLRRREGEILKPRVGPDGVHFFDEAEVRAVTITMRSRAALLSDGRSGGEIAADVFTLLDDGTHPVDIVKQLRLAPDLVIDLHAQWLTMRDAFLVNREQAADLARIARSGVAASASEAIASVRGRIETLTRMRQGSAVCSSCRATTASMCEACVVETRGPLGSAGVRIETRTTDDGAEQVRVAADMYWDAVGESGTSVATMHSAWHGIEALPLSSIVDIVDALRRRRDTHGG
jgi:hypothetical protein